MSTTVLFSMKFNGINIRIGKKVKIGNNVKIGDNTTIYDNVTIGDNTIICNDCVLGEPTNSFYSDDNYQNEPLIIGGNSLIRSHSIFYAGSRFGSHLQTGHRVTVREHTEMGDHCQIGSYGDIQGTCKIGNYVRMQSYVNIGQFSRVGDYVFLYPFVVLTNDPTPPSYAETGVELGDYSVIATGTIMLPGAKLGKHCLTAANSSVGGEYEDYSFISGNPAKRLCDIRKAPLFNVSTGKRHYPWPYNFSRNMPWDGMDYNEWLNLQSDNNIKL